MLRSILVSSVLFSLVACAQDPSADLDLDGIADADDNCPEQSNDEQFDADADGVGDACDLTVFMNEDGYGIVSADALTEAAIAVAEIANLTDAPQPFAVWTDSDALVAEIAEGVVEPGEIRTIYVDADARGFEPGAWLSGTVTVETEKGEDSAELGAETAAAPPPTTCTYTIKRDYVKCTQGEGGADPALELNGYVKFYAYKSGVEVGRSTYTGTLKKGVTAGTDVTMGSGSVSSGSAVTIDWDVDAEEVDTWDADDHGSGGGSLNFSCTSGGATVYGSDAISLGNGAIEVGVKATM